MLDLLARPMAAAVRLRTSADTEGARAMAGSLGLATTRHRLREPVAMGPVLLVIDEGHVAMLCDQGVNRGDLVCGRDHELWPCATMLAARIEQVQYAERLNGPPVSPSTWPVAMATR